MTPTKPTSPLRLTEEEIDTAKNLAGGDADLAVPDGRGFDMDRWSYSFEQALCRRIETAVLLKWADRLGKRFPRGGAHTYASENADLYREIEAHYESIAKELRLAAAKGETDGV